MTEVNAVQPKLKDPVIITVTFRDIPHFHLVIKWLNTHLGTGTKNWEIKKSVKKHLVRGQPVTRQVHINKPDFCEPEIEMLLNLM